MYHDHRVANPSGSEAESSITAAATWTFDGLSAGGTYRVWVKWVPTNNGSRSTRAPYAVFDGTNPIPLATTRINQQLQPYDSSQGQTVTRWGGAWLRLGTTDYTTTGTKLIVRLSNNVLSGEVVADAVHIEKV
jgi:hypothetical protein